MKRIRQTIEVAEPLWQALELMSRDMGVDRNALVAQALFQLARQNGYVSPSVVSLSGEAQADGGASVPWAEPVVQAAAPVVAAQRVVAPPVAEPTVAAVPSANPGGGAQSSVPAAAVVANADASAATPADSAVSALSAVVANAAAPAVSVFSADDATEDPTTEPPGVTPVPLAVAEVASTEMVLARMQEILGEVEASVQPSEGLAAQSDDADDDESDDSDDEDSDDDESDEVDDEDSDDADDEDSDDADDEASDDDSDEDSEDDASDEVSADSGVKSEVSADDIAAELAALGIVEELAQAAQVEAPVATPIAARPLVARPVPKIRLPDEAATILEDHSAETTNIVKGPAPLEVFVQWEQGTPVAVSTERFTIGRGPRCSLVVKSERVSREHAVVTRVGDEVFIEDLNSSNGTWFNNERITRHQVSDGDEYMLGTEAVSFTMRPAGG